MGDNLREIVNGAMLPQYLGRKVSIIGLVSKMNPNGLTFDIRSADDVVVKVNLRKPYTDPLEGHVEIHGVAQHGSTVICDEIIKFPLKDSVEFDATSYNILCQLLQSVSDLWRTSA